VAREQGWSTHMDGARLMNACVAAAIPPAEMVAGFDSVWLDFTKGLGAPLGAVLCGSREFIGQAWRWKQRLGGSMRQAGICAAACLHALDHHVDRLADAHAAAARLAEGLAELGCRVDPVETNIVFFDAPGVDAAGFLAGLAAEGVRMGAVDGRIRAVTHLDVDAAGIDAALAAARSVAARYSPR
jgi:threonine aldolase